MEQRETPLDTLKREIQEETGIRVDVRKAFPVHADMWGRKGDILKSPIVAMFYVVPVGVVDVELSQDYDKARWMDLRENLPASTLNSVVRAVRAYREHVGTPKPDKSLVGHQGYGLIQIFTGNGKGKTTAAIGEMVRACGAGKKVGLIAFDKGGADHYSEREPLEKLGVEIVVTGRDRISKETGRFDFSLTEEDKLEALRGLDELKKMFLEKYDLIVLDEVLSSADLGMVPIKKLISILEQKPKEIEIIMTGRNAPEFLKNMAHLVTEMRLRKHYYYSGVKAREGLDF